MTAFDRDKASEALHELVRDAIDHYEMPYTYGAVDYGAVLDRLAECVIDDRPEVPVIIRTFRCPECGKRFLSQLHYNEHIAGYSD